MHQILKQETTGPPEALQQQDPFDRNSARSAHRRGSPCAYRPNSLALTHRTKINLSTIRAGQRLGIKEVDDGIWLVSFMHYDPGYFDFEQRILQTSTNRSVGGCHPCLRYKLTYVYGSDNDEWWARQDSNLRPDRYERSALTN